MKTSLTSMPVVIVLIQVKVFQIMIFKTDRASQQKTNWGLFIKITISYLKPYANCVQTNDYYYIETITWNHIIICIRQEYLKPSNCVKNICIR